MNFIKLNTRGFAHHLALAVVVVGVVAGGTLYIVKSNANSCNVKEGRAAGTCARIGKAKSTTIEEQQARKAKAAADKKAKEAAGIADLKSGRTMELTNSKAAQSFASKKLESEAASKSLVVRRINCNDSYAHDTLNLYCQMNGHNGNVYCPKGSTKVLGNQIKRRDGQFYMVKQDACKIS